MRMSLIFFLFLVSLSSLSAEKETSLDGSLVKGQQAEGSRCWTNGNGKGPHWLDNGQNVERGKFWYECVDGKLKPAGCLDDTGSIKKQVPLNGSFISNGYLLECELWGGMARQKTVGCAQVGEKAFRIGQTWEEGEFWWECAWEGDRIKRRMAGCLDGKGRRMAIGEEVDGAGSIHRCQQSAQGQLSLMAVGCLTSDGGRHKIGQQWKEGDFLFYCKRTEEKKCQKTCIGCILQGQNLFDGDRLRQDREVFQCEVRPKRHSLKPVACVSSDGVDRLIDCKWHEQKSNGQRVERQCVLRAGRASVDTLGCVFAKDGINRIFLRPGTFTVWRESMDGPQVGVACRQSMANGVDPELETFPLEKMEEKTHGMEMDKDLRI